MRVVCEHRTPDGKLFAPELILPGTHRLTEIREMLRNIFVPAAQRDMKEGAYRAVFIKPEQVEKAQEDADRMWEFSEAARFGESEKGGLYFSGRGQPDHVTACVHSHPSYACTSAMAMNDGKTPTEYFSVDAELRSELVRHLAQINDGIHYAADRGYECLRRQQDLTGRSATPEFTSVMTRLHSTGYPYLMDALFDIHLDIYSEVEHVIHRLPSTGHVSIFDNSMTHASNPYQHPSADAAGEILTDHWKAV